MSENVASPSPSLPPTPTPTLSELFLGFAKISILGFGGVLAWSRRMLVDEKRWMSPATFNELYSLCQFLPGPNVINLSIMYGARIDGVRGAVVAFLGLISPAVTLMLVVGALYNHYGALPGLRGTLSGLAAGAAGLILANAVQMALPLFRKRIKPAHLIAAAAFVAIGVLQFPLQWVLALLIPVSIALAWVEVL
jgi:chromate transporter